MFHYLCIVCKDVYLFSTNQKKNISNCINNLGTWHFLWQKGAEEEEEGKKTEKHTLGFYAISCYLLHPLAYTVAACIDLCACMFLLLFVLSHYGNRRKCMPEHIQHTLYNINIFLCACALALESNGIHNPHAYKLMWNQ